jgi:hypothetical protein
MAAILPRILTPNGLALHADILPGYRFDSGRYRNLSTGRFVARTDITGLLEKSTAQIERDLGRLTTATMEGRVSSAAWAEQTRSEMRRLVLQQEALGAGGWDKLGPKQFGRAGRDLRDLYGRISATAIDMQEGKISVAQALARAREYAGHARSHFFTSERETVQASSTGVIVIERRVIQMTGPTCADCINFWEQGWQLFGVLPPPGTDSVCRGNCRCSLLRREVPAGEVNDWLNTKR